MESHNKNLKNALDLPDDVESIPKVFERKKTEIHHTNENANLQQLSSKRRWNKTKFKNKDDPDKAVTAEPSSNEVSTPMGISDKKLKSMMGHSCIYCEVIDKFFINISDIFKHLPKAYKKIHPKTSKW